MIAAPALIPANPLGAKPPVSGVVQFPGRISVRPTATKNRMIATLRITIALLDAADSRIPITRMQVMQATMRKAGRLAMTLKPKICGAVVRAEARYRLGASVAPAATASAAAWAERTSVASQGGS